MARTFKILSPTAITGYGFPEESFRKAMEESPDSLLLTQVPPIPPPLPGQVNPLPTGPV